MALTRKDLNAIDELIDKRISDNNKRLFEFISENNQAMSDHFVSKEELIEVRDYLEDKIKHLPTKDEFHKANDMLMKELKALREEVTISIHQTSRNTDRIEKLEIKVLGN